MLQIQPRLVSKPVLASGTFKQKSDNFSRTMKKGREAETFRNEILALEAKLKPKRILTAVSFINVGDFEAGKRAQDRNMLTKNDVPIRTVHCRKASPYTIADVERESAKRGVKLVQETIVLGKSVKYGLVSYAPFEEYIQNNRIISVNNVYKTVPPEVTGAEAITLGREIDMKQARNFCGSVTKTIPFAFAKFQFERNYPSEFM